jgi:hypothetical protein
MMHKYAINKYDEKSPTSLYPEQLRVLADTTHQFMVKILSDPATYFAWPQHLNFAHSLRTLRFSLASHPMTLSRPLKSRLSN